MRINKLIAAVATVAIVAAVTAAPASAQTKLKWAHVYETSEPFHKWSVWAAGEIEKRTNGRYHIDVFPASSLGKESDINQGLTLGTVDMIISGLSFAARTMPRMGVGYDWRREIATWTAAPTRWLIACVPWMLVQRCRSDCIWNAVRRRSWACWGS